MKKNALRSCVIVCGLCVGMGNILPIRARMANADDACTAKAACVMEQTSRRVLYEHRGDIRLPMASTTKIAAAITVLEECEDISQR